jgi:hypothetical protein
VKPRKAAEIQAALTLKGFRLDNTHHHFYWFFHGNRKTSIRTFVSHGIKEYGSSLLTNVRKQMKLAGNQLDEFIDCDMSGEAYRELLIANGHIKVESKKK